MGFMLKYLIFTLTTILLFFLPERCFTTHYKILFAVYMLIIGIIFML